MLTRILVCLAAGCFLGAGMLHGFALRANSPAPVARLATPEPVDLGAVDQGRKVPFTFRVENTADCPVTVVKLTPSCGCTWLDDVEGKRIEPGDVLSIRGTLDSEGRRGRTESHAVLTYASADASGSARNLILTVRADVRQVVRVVPQPKPITFNPHAASGAGESGR